MSAGISKIWQRRLIAGVLSWLIPFIASIPFYDRSGTLLIDYVLFKSIMMVIGGLSVAFLMVWFFRSVTTAYTRESVISGFAWLSINWLLDAIVIVGLLHMSPFSYIVEIGLGYLMIPAIVIAAGTIADLAIVAKNV
jgi:hypothetical protein